MALLTMPWVSVSGGMCVMVPYVLVEMAMASRARLIPKSATLETQPRESLPLTRLVSITFQADKSPCTMSWLCINCRALTISSEVAMTSASLGGELSTCTSWRSHPLSMASCRLPRSQYSMMIHVCFGCSITTLLPPETLSMLLAPDGWACESLLCKSRQPSPFTLHRFRIARESSETWPSSIAAFSSSDSSGMGASAWITAQRAASAPPPELLFSLLGFSFRYLGENPHGMSARACLAPQVLGLLQLESKVATERAAPTFLTMYLRVATMWG
mmetsp:Transcript_15107/g.40889  ORF Transcript_15107/g.40889 Transcript_15107/m.40889 type:complete len:273 (-) Transcript_15107:1665-2483(-)